jgi:hypothetical protein
VNVVAGEGSVVVRRNVDGLDGRDPVFVDVIRSCSLAHFLGQRRW